FPPAPRGAAPAGREGEGTVRCRPLAPGEARGRGGRGDPATQQGKVTYVTWIRLQAPARARPAPPRGGAPAPDRRRDRAPAPRDRGEYPQVPARHDRRQ